jgi:hypothetical protein
MAVDVSRIPNNNKFDPVREAILQLQEDIQAEGQIAYDGEITVGKVTGSTITVTGGSFSVNQSNNTTISIGIDDSGYYSTSGGEIDGNVDITGNLVVEGNLTVSGATITKLSEEVLIEDNIIVLNSNETGTPSLNSGIEIERGTSPNVDFLWNETSNEWDLQTYSGARIYRYGVGSTVLTIEAGSTAGDAVIALTPNTGTGGVIQTTNAKDLVFQPNSTTKMVIASGGDVNIYDSLAVGKTTAPSYALDVTGDGYFGRSSTSQTSVLTIEQLNDVGSSQDLLIKNANDRDVGIKLETGGGSHYIWQDSNGDDSLIISSVDTANSSITMEFYQNHNVEIPNGQLTVSGNINGNLVGNVTGNLSGNVTGGTISGTTGSFSGTLSLNAQDSLSFEAGKHWITYNDGEGNFNIRVGHKSNSSTTEECTEAGYIFHDEWSQTGGWRQFNVSADSMAVGELIGTDSSWYTQIEYDPSSVWLRYQGSTRLRTTSDGVTITGDLFATEDVYADVLYSTQDIGGNVTLRRNDTSISGTNTIGVINFEGDDPTDGTFNIGAQIAATADNASWGTGSYKSRILFKTDNGGTLTTALTIDSSQNSTFTGFVDADSLKIGGTTAIDSSRNVFANEVTANDVSATEGNFEDLFLTNASGASLSFRNSQGNTVDTDNLATMSFQGYYDSAYVGASRIQVKANEDFSSTARGSVINFDFWDTGSVYDTVAHINADGIYVGTTNLYDNLPTGITHSTTDNRLKIGVDKNVGSTTEHAIVEVLLSDTLTEFFVPYVASGDGGGATVNSKVSDSWLKINSDTLELGASDPVSHEVRYARFLWQSGSNDKVSTVYGARDISATINYLGGSATAKIAFTTGTGAGRIRFNDEFSFPATDGTSGQVLTTNGSGDLSWAAAGGSLNLQDVTDNGSSTTDTITAGGFSTSGQVAAKYLTLTNQELTLAPEAYSIWLDGNDSSAPASLGDYESTYPMGIYVNGDGGVGGGTLGSGTVQVYHTGHFSGTNISNWQSAYTYSQVGHLPLSGGTLTGTLQINASGVPQLLLDGGSDTTGDIVVPDGEILQVGHWNSGTSTYTSRFRIETNGNVKIGSGTAGHKLDVNGSINIDDISYSYKINDLNVLNVSTTYTRLYNPEGAIGLYIGDSGDRSNYYDNNYHYFRTAGGSSTLGVWNGTGLGIGTDSPSSKLEVQNGYITSSGAGAADLGFVLDRDGLDTYQIRHLDGGLTIFNETDNRKEMTFLGNGNIGINQSAPSYTLDVSGNTRLNGLVGINATPDSSYQLNMRFDNTNADDDFHFAQRIDGNFSGADNTTADREQGGIYLDIDSSADGDAANEHRLYGIYNDVRFTGFSDIAQGIYTRLESNNSTEKTSAMYAVYAHAVHDSGVNGGVGTMIANYGVASVEDAGDVDNAYAGFFLTSVNATRTENTGNLIGSRSEVTIDAPVALSLGDVYGIQSVIDNNEGTLPSGTDSYLFYGTYQGTRYATNAWGLYVQGDKHYLEGALGIGVGSPDYTFHAYHATTNVVGQFESGDNQAWVSVKDSGYGTYGAMLGCDSANSQAIILADNSANKRLVIDNNGDVGIGTDSPIQFTSDAYSLTLGSTKAGLSGALFHQINGTNKAYQWAGTSTGYTFNSLDSKYTWLLNTSTTAMVINSSGFVGINHDTPNVRLDVVDATTGTIATFSTLGDGGGSTNRGLAIKSTTDGGEITTVGSSTDLQLTAAQALKVITNGSQRLSISQSGLFSFNVGRGDVYFENNGNSNSDGRGITLRTTANPVNGSIFDVRSSGQGSRLFVGQSITTAGINPFYVGSPATGSEYDASEYAIALNTDGTIDCTSISADNLIASADFSVASNRFKLVLTTEDSNTIEASLDDVVLSSAIDADYVPYVTTSGGNGDTTNAILSDSFLKINSSTLELDWGDTVGVYTERNLKMRKDGGGFGTYYEATYAADSVSFLHYASASDIDTAKIGATSTGRIRINDTYSLPVGDGTNGQVLKTNGSGDLSWGSASGFDRLEETADALLLNTTTTTGIDVSENHDGHFLINGMGYILDTNTTGTTGRLGYTISPSPHQPSIKTSSDAGASGIGGGDGSFPNTKADSAGFASATTYTFAAALAGLQGDGARLPRLEEVCAGYGAGTGDSTDSQWIWTQTFGAKGYVYQVKGNFGSYPDFRLVDPTNTANVARVRRFFDVSKANLPVYYDNNARINVKEIRAEHSDGLKLHDDGGNGLHIQDGGFSEFDGAVGINTAPDNGSGGSSLKVQGGANGFKAFEFLGGAYASIGTFEFGYNGAGISVVNGAGYNATGISFVYGTSNVGNIVINSASTSYNTTSDYRLKENITEINDGIDRLKQLKPSRFNFIGHEEVVDGFIAHEAQAVVPEAVSGEKDAVDYNGDPDYQGIDQSKLVPLLTAALQEAVAKIEALEQRISNLENQ